MSDYMNKSEADEQFFNLMRRYDMPLPRFPQYERTVKTVRRKAAIISRCNLDACNGVMQPDGFMGLTEADQTRLDETRWRAFKIATDALNEFFGEELAPRLNISMQGDPRGPAICINENNGPERVATFW